MPNLRERLRRLKRRVGIQKNPATELQSASEHMKEILAERQTLRAKIEEAARNGLLASALVTSLSASYDAELVEWRRLSAAQQQGLEICLRRLDAMWPAAQPPMPEPPAPPPPKHFRRLGKILAQSPETRPH